MGLKLLMENLEKRASVSSDTSEGRPGYRCNVPIHADCTRDTSDTSHQTDTYVNAQYLQFCKVLTDPGEPLKQTRLEHCGAWRELAEAYHTHHFTCKYCQAAGRGERYGEHCTVGLALWNAYQTVI